MNNNTEENYDFRPQYCQHGINHAACFKSSGINHSHNNMTYDSHDHEYTSREDVRENDEEDTKPDTLDVALAELHQTNLRYIEAAQKFTDAAVSLIATIKRSL